MWMIVKSRHVSFRRMIHTKSDILGGTVRISEKYPFFFGWVSTMVTRNMNLVIVYQSDRKYGERDFMRGREREN